MMRCHTPRRSTPCRTTTYREKCDMRYPIPVNPSINTFTDPFPRRLLQPIGTIENLDDGSVSVRGGIKHIYRPTTHGSHGYYGYCMSSPFPSPLAPWNQYLIPLRSRNIHPRNTRQDPSASCCQIRRTRSTHHRLRPHHLGWIFSRRTRGDGRCLGVAPEDKRLGFKRHAAEFRALGSRADQSSTGAEPLDV